MPDIKINHLPIALGIAATDLFFIGHPVTGIIKQISFSNLMSTIMSSISNPVVPVLATANLYWSITKLWVDNATLPTLDNAQKTTQPFVHNTNISLNLPAIFNDKFFCLQIPDNEPRPTGFNNGSNTSVGDNIPGTGQILIVQGGGFWHVLTTVTELSIDISQPLNFTH